jgi:hypothetical protein
MRKSVFLIVFAFILLVGISPVWAVQTAIKTYDLSLSVADSGTTSAGGTWVSGSTTVANGGASPFILSGQDYVRTDGLSTIKDVRYLNSGNGMLWITNLTISQYQQGAGAPYSGNTFYVVVKSIPQGGDWTYAESIPICPPMAMSGATRYGIPFILEPGAEHRFYFVSSGITAYDQAKGTVEIGLPGVGFPPVRSIPISSQTLTVTSASGVSTLTVPDGARSVTIMPITHGIYYTLNGSTPDTTSKHIAVDSLLTVSREEAKVLKLYGDNAAASTVNVDYLSK